MEVATVSTLTTANQKYGNTVMLSRPEINQNGGPGTTSDCRRPVGPALSSNDT